MNASSFCFVTRWWPIGHGLIYQHVIQSWVCGVSEKEWSSSSWSWSSLRTGKKWVKEIHSWYEYTMFNTCLCGSLTLHPNWWYQVLPATIEYFQEHVYWSRLKVALCKQLYCFKHVAGLNFIIKEDRKQTSIIQRFKNPPKHNQGEKI